jgi:polyisoprenoid-binding protein YceI
LQAAAPGHPFVGAGPYRQPCREAPPLACNGCMHTEPEHAAAPPQPGHLDIDPSQSAVTFRTRHLFGLAPVRGTFALRGGTVDIAEPVAESGIHAEIETASFRTSNSQRDRSVLSPRFLDPGKHPVMTFRSERIDFDRRELAGTLTVRDVSRPVSFTVGELAAIRGQLTARATARIDRTEFGITAARGLAARYLDITVEVQCVRN